ncbi:MAG: hypothetical protein LBG58_11100, partial [Planctomycetaceae bacterium]|nr:hypothetical protein [Planctomycetaceae bacterium]
VENGTEADENVEVQRTYDGLDNDVTLTAVNPATGNQVTKYLYEDSYNASLQTSAIYPDSTDTTSTGTDQVKTTYYLDSNSKTQTDQNGSVRTFLYDSYRRPIVDSVTTLGSNVDGTVRKISRTYTTQGALEKVSSIDLTNAVLNEVKYEYDANLKLKKLQQSYSGAVTTSTPSLEYSYDSAHDNRLSGVVYPSGKVIGYSYDSFDNVTSISEGTAPLVSYIYDGSNNPIQTVYNQPNVSLTYVNGGLDRYGRIINHSWVKNNNALVHIVHGYDYAGNRLYRNDIVQSVNSELYSYDNLGQIKTLNRGTLNANQTYITTVNHSESWNFDKTGNWSQYTKNGNTENRTHNAANELQGIATHDANGNMILMPGLKGKYDAWNRLVEVRDPNDNLIANYEYNGLNQRIKKTVDSTVTKSFFNENWQEIESVTNDQVTSYVWGLRYIDDLVLREKGEERLYSLADPNWNVVAICNITGDIQERYAYDAFGKRNVFDANFTAKAGTEFDWNRAFTGQVLDFETGLMLYRNRFYHTGLGRFVTRDPIGYKSKDINIYRYVSNASSVKLDWNGFSGGFPVYTLPDDKANCQKKVKRFEEWHKKEMEETAWQTGLPSCPCTMNLRNGLFLDVGYYTPHYEVVGGNVWYIGGATVMQTGSDWVSIKDEWSIEWQIASSSDWSWSYHSGSKFCVRSKKPAGSQCCYDTNNRLITGGSAAGTADKNKPSHQEADMDPANLAWWLDGGCFGEYSKQYLEVRPPVGAKNCPPNEITPKSRECPPTSKGRCCD